MRSDILIVIFCILALVAGCEKDESDSNAAQTYKKVTFEVIFGSLKHYATDIFFFDEMNGVLSTGKGGIYKTGNGGKSWSQTFTDSTIKIIDLHFIDNNVGFALCQDPGDRVSLLKTSNAGTTWARISSNLNSYMRSKLVTNTLGHLFIVQGPGDGYTYLSKSEDQGLNFSKLYKSSSGIGILEFDGNKGYCLTNQSHLMISNNNGQDWQPIGTNDSSIVLAQIKGSIGLSVYGGSHKKSADRGLTWKEIWKSDSPKSGVQIIDNNTYLTAGDGSYSGGDFGRMYAGVAYTLNGGLTWTEIDFGNYSEPNWTETDSIQFSGGTPIQASHFYEKSKGYILGGHLIKVTFQ